MDGIEQQFRWAIQAVAQPADVQPSLFPSFVVVADELALEFDNWLKAFERNFGKSWTPEQRESVMALDQLLSEMSGADKPELWLKPGCLDHPKWSEVRKLACRVLFAFGWTLDRPPLRRAQYAPAKPSA